MSNVLRHQLMTIISKERENWETGVSYRDDHMLFDGERTGVERPTHTEGIEDLHWDDACP